MLVRTDDGAIKHMDRPIQIAGGVGGGLEGRQDLIPDAGLPPAVEATGDGPPGAIPLRQIAPRRASAQNPENSIDDRAMITIGPAGRWFLRREQRLELLPLRGGKVMTIHTIGACKTRTSFANTP